MRSSRSLLLAAAPLLLAAAPADTTTVGGHTYRFPHSAFQGGMVETGPVRAILLELKWPELTGLSFADQLRPAGSGTLLILGNSGAETIGGALPQAELNEAVLDSIAAAVSRYGQQAFPLRPKQATTSEPVPADGMHAVEADAGTGQELDAFVAPVVETPQELITCGSLMTVPYPRCSQYFIEQGLLLKVSYERRLVPQWQQIHSAVAQYLTSNEVTR